MHVRVVDARHDELAEEIDAARGLQLLEVHRLSNRHDPIPSNRHRLGERPPGEETTVHQNEVDRPQRLLRTASDCEERNGEKSFHWILMRGLYETPPHPPFGHLLPACGEKGLAWPEAG